MPNPRSASSGLITTSPGPGTNAPSFSSNMPRARGSPRSVSVASTYPMPLSVRTSTVPLRMASPVTSRSRAVAMVSRPRGVACSSQHSVDRLPPSGSNDW